MRYQWNEWTLDREDGRLTRQGQPVEASRRVIECIGHLIVHRERVVGYEELIGRLWVHGSASNHQLSQVILAARRLLSDDGQTQHCIRTVTGQGYHWVAPTVECERAATAAFEPGMDQASAAVEPGTTRDPATALPAHHRTAGRETAVAAPVASVDAAAAERPRPLGTQDGPDSTARTSSSGAVESGPITDRRRNGRGQEIPPGVLSGRLRRRAAWGFVALAACGIAVAAMGVFGPGLVEPFGDSQTQAADDTGTFASLRRILAKGRYDEVREALSKLPNDLAESREATLIAIDLDIQRGRFDGAGNKIDTQMKALQPSRDPIWHAQLLMRESTLNSRRQSSGAEVFAPADTAVTLLLSQPNGVPQDLLGEALRIRANGYNLTNRSEAALRDLAEALDIHEREGDAHRMAIVRASRARTWMRMGRMTDALDELSQVADVFQSHEDKVNEVLARNTMAKIQIESLQWQGALASTQRSMLLLREMQDSDRRYPTMQLRALALVGVGRLREAASLLEDADASGSQRRNGIIPAIHLLETGQPQLALEAAAKDFEASRIDTRTNLLLENREGALLLWMMAAQALADRGETPPPASVAQLTMLESPTNAVARIARGRWLLLRGKDDEAERELRHSLQDAQSMSQRLRMILAAEPLVDLMLRRGDTVSARRVVDDLYGFDPDAMGGDYRFSLLRLRIALADEKPGDYENAHRKALQLAGERALPGSVESLYAERRHREGGALWSGPVSPGER